MRARVVLCCYLLSLGLSGLSCSPTGTASGLPAGVSYTQPLKWRLTQNYHVQRIYPLTNGKGSWEVWLVEPASGECLRACKMTYADPQPQQRGHDEASGTNFVYYDFATQGQLPEKVDARVSWEFITFERLTAWPPAGTNLPTGKLSTQQLKTYLADADPISWPPELARQLQFAHGKERHSDEQEVARDCMDRLIEDVVYDEEETLRILFLSEPKLIDSTRAWNNRQGQCDELVSLYCAMLRSVGIPSRPVGGYVHSEGLEPGGHAWAEYYDPQVGWTPVDVTWCYDPEDIPLELSTWAWSGGGMKMKDYYFGNLDTYRIPVERGWNIKLDPPPDNPKCKTHVPYMVNYFETYTGVKDVVEGWEGIPSAQISENTHGWVRSADAVGYNCDTRIELLGIPTQAELKPVLEEFEAEGSHYVKSPPVQWDFPIQTAGEVL